MSPTKQVIPVVDLSVRKLCYKPYYNHPRGCPNYGKRDTCPPNAPLIYNVLDLSKPIYCVYNVFDFGNHVKKMREKHPKWSKRQVECCLYWQGKARKSLKNIIELFLETHRGMKVIECPEACGINVTSTMKKIGIELEWFPRTLAYQVVLVGYGGKLNE